jgi:hypothetical protein
MTLKKRPTKQRGVGKRPGKEQTNGRADKDQPWSVPLMLDREELMIMLQDCLTDFATEVGLKVACLLFDKQVAISCKRMAEERSTKRRLSASARQG